MFLNIPLFEKNMYNSIYISIKLLKNHEPFESMKKQL